MTFRSAANPMIRSEFAETILQRKYLHEDCETWDKLCLTLAHEVCDGLIPTDAVGAIYEAMRDMKIIPGGRYLYYAGRPNKFYNNCYLLKCEEDSREDWALLSYHAENALMTGGGIGSDYTVYRAKGQVIKGTGGLASGPLDKMMMINEIGRHVMQGGARRSAMYASLSWAHADAMELLTVKNWDNIIPGTNITYGDAKKADFNFHCPLDMTNVSLNYDDAWLGDLYRAQHPVFRKNIEQAMRTGEPGFSFNFGAKGRETLRNACTEVTSEDDSDVCNLGSVNFGRIDSLDELNTCTNLLTQFLICGGVRAKLPYAKVYDVRAKNNRIGVGLMGLHEWLIKRGLKYEVGPELDTWLGCWEDTSDSAATSTADAVGVAHPKGVRAVAPTGTIGLIADTSTGIEPLFAVAYKRRFLKGQSDWQHMYVVDATAQHMVDSYGVDPDSIETALTLAGDVRRRLEMQARVQDHVDMSISSTINMPAWGSEQNNEGTLDKMADLVAEFAPRIRGLTIYPDGARGGQPLTAVPYGDAKCLQGQVFTETHDICEVSGKGGTCGA